MQVARSFIEGESTNAEMKENIPSNDVSYAHKSENKYKIFIKNNIYKILLKNQTIQILKSLSEYKLNKQTQKFVS